MSDAEIQHLESQFPGLSGKAFAEARRNALDAGFPVMQSEDGFLVEVHPDGRKERLKSIEPWIPVQAGAVFTIR
jgi:hypothetical protein